MIKTNLVERISITLLIIFFIFSACATEQERKRIRSESAVKVKAEPMLPIEAIEKKISILEELLANNMVPEEERVTVANLIVDYHRIRELSRGEASQDDLREIILTLFNNLSMLDERYLESLGQASDEIYLEAAKELNLKKQDIYINYINKDYAAVISECEEMQEVFGEDSIAFETGILLAMSLAAEGRFTEAIEIGDKIIAEIEQRPDLIHLRAGIIQWRIDTGNKENALKEYQELIEDIDQCRAVLDKTTEMVNTRDVNTVESAQALDMFLDKEFTPDNDSRIAGILKEIDNLKKQADFTGARLLLLKWKLRTDDPVELAEINKAITDLELSESEYLERIKTDSGEGIEAATKMIEEEDYESAINLLDLIKSNGDLSPEIDKKRAIAVERLINEERNRAARIFLTAKKTNDIKKKRELLLSAQDILADLIEKYPSSGMVEKVKSNLDSVNDELIKTGADAPLLEGQGTAYP